MLVEDTARRHYAALPVPSRSPGTGAAGAATGTREEGAEVPTGDRVEVVVRRVTSPLDTASIHGRGHGVLRTDPGVEVTFLLDQPDFVDLRRQLLANRGEVLFTVDVGDVTAIDASRSVPPA